MREGATCSIIHRVSLWLPPARVSLVLCQEFRGSRAVLFVDLKLLAGDPQPRQVHHGILTVTPSRCFISHPVYQRLVLPLAWMFCGKRLEKTGNLHQRGGIFRVSSYSFLVVPVWGLQGWATRRQPTPSETQKMFLKSHYEVLGNRYLFAYPGSQFHLHLGLLLFPCWLLA